MPRRARGRKAARKPTLLTPLRITIAVALVAAIGVLFALLYPGDPAPAAGDADASPSALKGNLSAYAHRGTVQGLPENSLEGIRAALRAPDADGVEIDVREDDAGVLRLSHDPPVPPGAPTLAEAFSALLEPGVRPTKVFLLDIKGDGALALRVANETPEALRLEKRVAYMLRSVSDARLFRPYHPTVPLWINPAHEEQGVVIPSELSVGAVVLTAGYATTLDVEAHSGRGTPYVFHAINSLTRARELGGWAIITKFPADGRLREELIV